MWIPWCPPYRRGLMGTPWGLLSLRIHCKQPIWCYKHIQNFLQLSVSHLAPKKVGIKAEGSLPHAGTLFFGFRKTTTKTQERTCLAKHTTQHFSKTMNKSCFPMVKKKENFLLILFWTKVTIVLCIVCTAKAAQAATHWRVMYDIRRQICCTFSAVTQGPILFPITRWEKTILFHFLLLQWL